MFDWVDALLKETGEFGIPADLLESGFNAAASNAPWWASLPTFAQNIAQLITPSAVVGGLAGAAGGSKPAGTITTTTDLPEWQKALLIPAITQSGGILNSQLGQPSPLIEPATRQLQSTISGEHLNGSPALGNAFEQGARQIRARLTPTFGQSQAFGRNSGHGNAIGRTLSDFSTNLYGGNYQNERQRQLTASAAAPGFTSESSSAAWSPFKNYMDIAGGAWRRGGFGGSQSNPYFSNPMASALSGAQLGARLFR